MIQMKKIANMTIKDVAKAMFEIISDNKSRIDYLDHHIDIGYKLNDDNSEEYEITAVIGVKGSKWRESIWVKSNKYPIIEQAYIDIKNRLLSELDIREKVINFRHEVRKDKISDIV